MRLNVGFGYVSRRAPPDGRLSQETAYYQATFITAHWILLSDVHLTDVRL